MIYLASKSPRRRQLLEQIGIAHEVLDIEADEIWDGKEAPAPHVSHLVTELKEKRYKARLGRQYLAREQAGATSPVLAADTAVVLNGEILGKAETATQAGAMLRRLSGCSHEVYSGVALIDAGGTERTSINLTRVQFRPLSDAELSAYCRSGEPIGKAGGYAIQGRAAAFIQRIEGSYSGVMGLPLFETAGLLTAIGITLS